MRARGLDKQLVAVITAHHPEAQVHRLKNRRGPDYLTIAVDTEPTLIGRHRIARAAMTQGFHVTFEVADVSE